MSDAEKKLAGQDAEDPGPPLTVALLADLQAGLLDDEDAARVRRRVRADPHAEDVLRALNCARREVAGLRADPGSAPEVPPEVTAKISAALRSASPLPHDGAAHSARPRAHPARAAATVAGLGAAFAALGVGTAALLHPPTPTPSAPVTAQHITVSTTPMVIPLSQPEILALLTRPADYGPLAGPLHDLSRRASCLGGLGYPASTPVLGARPVQINARPGVVLVLPGDSPEVLAVLAVSPSCSAADTGLLASSAVPRP
ncbi:MAG: hypothetical protein PHQ28_08845 [Mycobacterium sp.]|nr:hypothetical protein [Mycobacterium sp.]